MTALHSSIVGALALILALVPGCSSEQASQEHPNIVLIIGDDHGYPDFGFMGAREVKTPNLDRLAEEGVVFTHGFAAASYCKASLQSLLTGLEPYQIRMRLASRPRAADAPGPKRGIESLATLPRLLAERGYESFQAGKSWWPSHTTAGFTDGIPGRAPTAFSSFTPLGRPSIAPVVSFLERPHAAPFFLWFAPMLPHVPHDAPEVFREPYEGLGLSEGRLGYLANVSRFDALVGELLETLEARGLRENTLVVYLSDNGWDPSEPVDGSKDGPRGKGTLHELALRTPIVLSWPGQVRAGGVHDDLVSTIDVLPTLLDYAGVETPLDRMGRSLRPVSDGAAEDPREVLIGWAPITRVFAGARLRGARPSLQPPDGYHLRTARWHYLWHPSLGVEALHDLETDPQEKTDLSRRERQRIVDFRRQITEWREHIRTSERPAPTLEPSSGDAPPD